MLACRKMQARWRAAKYTCRARARATAAGATAGAVRQRGVRIGELRNRAGGAMHTERFEPLGAQRAKSGEVGAFVGERTIAIAVDLLDDPSVGERHGGVSEPKRNPPDEIDTANQPGKLRGVRPNKRPHQTWRQVFAAGLGESVRGAAQGAPMTLTIAFDSMRVAHCRSSRLRGSASRPAPGLRHPTQWPALLRDSLISFDQHPWRDRVGRPDEIHGRPARSQLGTVASPVSLMHSPPAFDSPT
jgi:hypothetical protein